MKPFAFKSRYMSFEVQVWCQTDSSETYQLSEQERERGSERGRERGRGGRERRESEREIKREREK